MKVAVKMRGTCGEFAQGFFRGEPVLITCPIEKFSTAIVSDEFCGVEGLGSKSRTILGNVLKIFGVREFKFGGRLTSELPRGKGMASSSADMAAVAQAVALSKNFTRRKNFKLRFSITAAKSTRSSSIVAVILSSRLCLT